MNNESREPVQLPYATTKGRLSGSRTLRQWIAIWIIGLAFLGIAYVPISMVSQVMSPRTTCADNLRWLGQSLYIYAGENTGAGLFPDQSLDWQKTLLSMGNITTSQLQCPSASRSKPSYYYVPGYGETSAPSQPVVYENPANHSGEGGNVLFQDGHVEFIKAPKYQALINSLKLPDGRPWAPHLAAKK